MLPCLACNPLKFEIERIVYRVMAEGGVRKGKHSNRLTPRQLVELAEWKRAHPKVTHTQLAFWAKEAFGLQCAPAKGSVTKMLNRAKKAEAAIDGVCVFLFFKKDMNMNCTNNRF